MSPLRRTTALTLLLFGLFGLFGGKVSQAAPGAPAQDIRDIHGPIAMRTSPSWPYLAGAGIVVAAAAGVALWRRRRKQPVSPAARALQALAEARALTAVDTRGFAFAVSEIVRQYVEEAFVLRATHRTTEELLVDLLRDQSPVAAHRAELAEFLRYCDLAKFAGWSLSPTDMGSMLASAEAFVRATAPPPPGAAHNSMRSAEPVRGTAT